MGYQNLSRGCSRIADWEAGRAVPRGDRAWVLQQALEVDAEPIEGLLAAFLAAGKRARSAHHKEEVRRWQVGRAELVLLARHRGLLLQHAPAILDNPAWSEVRIAAAQVGLAYIGGCSLTLGGILRSWLDGTGVVDHPDGPLYALCVSGSPLSGRNSVLAFGEDGKLVSTRDPGFKRRVLPMLEHARSQERGTSAWSLSQVLSALGVSVPDLLFCEPDGAEVWRYNHASMTVHGAEGTADLSLLFETDTGEARWTANWDETRTGRRITIGQISPLRRGSFRGDGLAWSDSQGRKWTAPRGCLVRSSGAVVFTLDAIAPPAVLSWMVEQA
jgi:hypothetical protein